MSNYQSADQMVDLALANRLHYPMISRLLTPEQVEGNIRENYVPSINCPLTVGISLALAKADSTYPPAAVASSLESNLDHFSSALTARGEAGLAEKLLNRDKQYLNTLSELGLARWYSDQGGSVAFEEPLPSGRDIDFIIDTGNERQWVEVLNAEARKNATEGFLQMEPDDFKKRLEATIIRKYRKKFSKDDVPDNTWIALDVIKNDHLALGVVNGQLLGLSRLEAFASQICEVCSELAGVIYYTHYADSQRAHWVRAIRREEGRAV